MENENFEVTDLELNLDQHKLINYLMKELKKRWKVNNLMSRRALILVFES